MQIVNRVSQRICKSGTISLNIAIIIIEINTLSISLKWIILFLTTNFAHRFSADEPDLLRSISIIAIGISKDIINDETANKKVASIFESRNELTVFISSIIYFISILLSYQSL